MKIIVIILFSFVMLELCPPKWTLITMFLLLCILVLGGILAGTKDESDK